MDNLQIGGVGGAAGGGITNIKVSAGTLSANRSDITFDNAGGVTFGLETNGVITAVAPAAGGGLTNIKVSAGTLSALRSDITFSNANGMSFGLDTSGVITGSYSQSTHSHATAAYSGSNGSFTANTVTFGNLNGLSFYTSNGSMVGSHNALTTARASNDAVGLNTAQTNVTWTVNSNGISLNAGGYAGVGETVTTTAGTDLKLTADTNGINIAHPLWLTTARASTDAVGLNTAQTNVTWTVNSAGISLNAGGYAGTGTSATNASVTLNSNGLAISVAAPGGGGAVNFSAGTTSNDLTNVVFSNSNGVSFGLNGSTITAKAGVNTLFEYPTFYNMGAIGVIQGRLFMRPAELKNEIQMDRAGFIVQITNASNSTGSVTLSFFLGLYTKNASTLSVLHSTSITTAHTFHGTVSSWTQFGGVRLVTIPWTTTMTGGNYYIGSFWRTTTGGANASFSLYGENDWGSAANIYGTSASTGMVVPGWGFYSATSNALPASIAFSQIITTIGGSPALGKMFLMSGTV